MDEPKTQTAHSPQWCLVGNIVRTRPYGPSGGEHRPGTLHFSGGTKVWCLPAQWGDDYEQIVVIGRHRSTKKFVTMIVSVNWIVNWRAQLAYNPEVLRRLNESIRAFEGRALRNWRSEQEVHQYLSMLAKRPRADDRAPSSTDMDPRSATPPST